MTDKKMIPIEEADFPSLRHYAETILGIEVKQGTNAANLRGKILSIDPKVKEIEELMTPGSSGRAEAVVKELNPVNPNAKKQAYSLGNPVADPRVILTIEKTTDPLRDPNVTIGVNGYIWRAQRGVRISVPYRAFLALDDAVEKRAIDTGETHPQTGLPIYRYEDVQSYPFVVHEMPAPEEIAAWHKATCEHPESAAA